MKLLVCWYDGSEKKITLFNIIGEVAGPFGLTPELLKLEGPEISIDNVILWPDDWDTVYLIECPGDEYPVAAPRGSVEGYTSQKAIDIELVP